MSNGWTDDTSQATLMDIGARSLGGFIGFIVPAMTLQIPMKYVFRVGGGVSVPKRLLGWTLVGVSAVSSYATAHLASQMAQPHIMKSVPRRRRRRFQTSDPDTYLSSETLWGTTDAALVGAHVATAGGAACLAYYALGGRDYSLLPSYLDAPGAFRDTRSAPNAKLEYATQKEKAQIVAAGKRFGCHTCGDRAPVTFIGDHQPTVKAAAAYNKVWWRRLFRVTMPQKFYPHCEPCSLKQSSVVRDTKFNIFGHPKLSYSLKRLQLHVFRLRAYHSTGLLLGALSYFSTSDPPAWLIVVARYIVNGMNNLS